MRDLANFAIPNDTAYLTTQPTMGHYGGYPGAVMGNFFGNHDQVRALTQSQNHGGGYERLRLAQTFLFTSPQNVPMLYQGDDIGTTGDIDPDNRKMKRFTGLSADEQVARERPESRLARADHPALRRGTRTTVWVEDWFWVYKVSVPGRRGLRRAQPRQHEIVVAARGLHRCAWQLQRRPGTDPVVVHLRQELIAGLLLVACGKQPSTPDAQTAFCTDQTPAPTFANVQALFSTICVTCHTAGVPLDLDAPAYARIV